MPEIALKIVNLSKQYSIGKPKLSGLRESLASLFKHSDNSKTSFFALRNFNLEVAKGEVLGIIGSNGAGKSTLLKLISKVTAPSSGTIEFWGSVGSLLEVGTGFHPEMTGRENIFMNGSILGMSRAEIKTRFHEIVNFAGVETFLDTPIKNYSSGMQLRLGFAVAAHLNPDILLVDEVLAVGDLEFQKKCIQKMDTLSAEEGKTILFVSHQLAAVQKLCSRVIWIEGGALKMDGKPEEVIRAYMNVKTDSLKASFESDSINTTEGIVEAGMFVAEKLSPYFRVGDEVEIRMLMCTESPCHSEIVLAIYDENGEKISRLSSEYGNEFQNRFTGKMQISCTLKKLPLRPGRYLIHAAWFKNGIQTQHFESFLSFQVDDGDFFGTGKLGADKGGKFYIDQDWKSRSL